MGGTKHLMDETAERLEIDDPNDPKVRAEVTRLLSIGERRLIVIESHPNSGGFWVGKLGSAREIKAYLLRLQKLGHIPFVFAILELKGSAENEYTNWISTNDYEDGEVLLNATMSTVEGTPPLPGLEKRLARITSNAYGKRRSVWSVLQGMTDVEVEQVFNGYLEDVLQRGITLPNPPETRMICTSCGWIGPPDECVTVYNHNPKEPGDVTPEIGCPKCGADTIEEVSAK